MFRRGLPDTGKTILPEKLGGGGNPGYPDEYKISRWDNPLSPLLLSWRAPMFIIYHLILTITMMSIFTVSCLHHNYAYSNFDEGIGGEKTRSTILAVTNKIYYQTRMEELYSHPAWWRVKHSLFHSTMIALYAYDLMSNAMKRFLIPLIFTMATPLMPIFKAIAYIVGVKLGIYGELYTELVYFIMRFRFYKPENKPPWEPIVLKFGTYQHHTPPLPSRFMVLSGVLISQAFVCWLEKMLGKTLTFFEKLHHFGIHKMMVMVLLSSQSISTTATNINLVRENTLESFRTTYNISEHIKDLLSGETNHFDEATKSTQLSHERRQIAFNSRPGLISRTPLCLPC